MTSFSDFINGTFGFKDAPNKDKLDAAICTTNYSKMTKFADDLMFTSQVCSSLMPLIPNIKKDEILDSKTRFHLVKSLETVRQLFLRNKKETEDVLFWLNQYIKECANNGKTST